MSVFSHLCLCRTTQKASPAFTLFCSLVACLRTHFHLLFLSSIFTLVFRPAVHCILARLLPLLPLILSSLFLSPLLLFTFLLFQCILLFDLILFPFTVRLFLLLLLVYHHYYSYRHHLPPFAPHPILHLPPPYRPFPVQQNEVAVGASCLDMERTSHCGELWRERRGREGEEMEEKDRKAQKGRKVKENEEGFWGRFHGRRTRMRGRRRGSRKRTCEEGQENSCDFKIISDFWALWNCYLFLVTTSFSSRTFMGKYGGRNVSSGNSLDVVKPVRYAGLGIFAGPAKYGFLTRC